VAITGAAAVLLAVVLDSLLFPLRSRSIPAVLAVLSPAAAIAVPLALLPRASEGPRPVPVATEVVVPTRRIRLIGIDGVGPADLRRGMDDDQLPGFARG